MLQVEPILLKDESADELTKSPNKKTMHYHHNANAYDTHEVSLCFSIAEPTSAVFNTVYIQHSEKYHLLFETLRSLLLAPNVEGCMYSGLTMVNLNKWMHIINSEPENELTIKIQKRIGNIEIPKRFNAVYFPLPSNCIITVDPRIIRCATNCFPGDNLRIRCLFRICKNVALPHNSNLPNFLQSRAARNFELSKCKDPQIWPHITSLKIANALMCLNVNHKKDDILKFVETWIDYLNKLQSTTLYRTPSQLQSKHIPGGHGRSLYGHCLPENLNVWKFIESVINSGEIFPNEGLLNSIVTTCDISIQENPETQLN